MSFNFLIFLWDKTWKTTITTRLLRLRNFDRFGSPTLTYINSFWLSYSQICDQFGSTNPQLCWKCLILQPSNIVTILTLKTSNMLTMLSLKHSKTLSILYLLTLNAVLHKYQSWYDKAVATIVWNLGLNQHMQSTPITDKGVSSIHSEVYSMHAYQSYDKVCV